MKRIFTDTIEVAGKTLTRTIHYHGDFMRTIRIHTRNKRLQGIIADDVLDAYYYGPGQPFGHGPIIQKNFVSQYVGRDI